MDRTLVRGAVRLFVIALAVQGLGALALFIDLRDPSWFASHLGSALGSAILITSAGTVIELAAKSAPEIGRAMRICGWLGFGAGWCFSVLGGTIIAFHPVMLIYIVMFGTPGLVLGLALGAAVGSVFHGARSAGSP